MNFLIGFAGIRGENYKVELCYLQYTTLFVIFCYNSKQYVK